MRNIKLPWQASPMAIFHHLLLLSLSGHYEIDNDRLPTTIDSMHRFRFDTFQQLQTLRLNIVQSTQNAASETGGERSSLNRETNNRSTFFQTRRCRVTNRLLALSQVSKSCLCRWRLWDAETAARRAGNNTSGRQIGNTFRSIVNARPSSLWQSDESIRFTERTEARVPAESRQSRMPELKINESGQNH
jgi:hypothetical protein